MLNTNDIRKKFIDYFVNNGFKHLMHCPVVSDENDNTLFTVAGMKPFGDFFRDPNKATYQKIVTVQPCLRIAGKHDDLSNIGVTTRHQTLFEMLGIFSFGQLTKRDTIYYLWNFITKELGINKQYLYATIYKNDDEAYNIWCELIDSNRIARAEMDTNFWSAGNVGLCGPCSEIFFDKEKTAITVPYQEIYLEDRFLEICNMVFMSYDRQNENDTEEEMQKLPKVCIDVGAGLERLSSVVNGSYDNYTSETIKPIMDCIEEEYSWDSWNLECYFIQNTTNIRNRVVADHLRAILFIISEGTRPSPRNQGHVLRRLIRRVLMYWFDQVTTTGVTCPIFINSEAIIEFFKSTVQALSYYEQELQNSIQLAADIIEEECDMLNNIIIESQKYIKKHSDNINEEMIVNLHTTYGMPIEIAMAICEYQYKKSLNMEKIEELIQQHTNKNVFTLNTKEVTIKECYEKTNSTSYIIELFNKVGKRVNTLNNEEGFIITRNTPFYAQGGGQPGDKGIITCANNTAEVINTIYQKIAKEMYTIIHIVNVSGGLHINDKVNMQVDEHLRQSHTRAHSATHLLYDCLASKYSIKQAGSKVSIDQFTLDIECAGHKFNDLHTNIEQWINEVINKCIPVKVNIVDKLTVPELIQVDKYDDKVRVITMGNEVATYSRQLCGGTHVLNTKDIINFKIISETSIASNTRRFTCVVNYSEKEKAEKIENKLEIETKELLYKDFMIIECKNCNNNEFQNIFDKYKKQYKNVIIYIIREQGTNMICQCDIQIAEKIHKEFNCFGIVTNKPKFNFGTKQILNNQSFINIL